MKSTYAILVALVLTTSILSCTDKKTATQETADVHMHEDGSTHSAHADDTKTEQEHFTVGADSATRKTEVKTADPVKATEEEAHPHGDDTHKH